MNNFLVRPTFHSPKNDLPHHEQQTRQM